MTKRMSPSAYRFGSSQKARNERPHIGACGLVMQMDLERSKYLARLLAFYEEEVRGDVIVVGLPERSSMRTTLSIVPHRSER